MTDADRIRELEARLAERREEATEAAAETEACLEFLRTEMDWEYFRAEMLYHDDEPKKTRSTENARQLRNFLAKSGRGKAVLSRLRSEVRRETIEECARRVETADVPRRPLTAALANGLAAAIRALAGDGGKA